MLVTRCSGCGHEHVGGDCWCGCNAFSARAENEGPPSPVPSAGQEQAFMEWWLRYSQEVYVSAPPRKGWMVDVARTAFNTGMELGLELRSCCEHKEEHDDPAP